MRLSLTSLYININIYLCSKSTMLVATGRRLSSLFKTSARLKSNLSSHLAMIRQICQQNAFQLLLEVNNWGKPTSVLQISHIQSAISKV